MAILYVKNKRYDIFEPGDNVQYYRRTDELFTYIRREGTVEYATVNIDDNVNVSYRICGERVSINGDLVFNIDEDRTECALAMNDYTIACKRLDKEKLELKNIYNQKLRTLGVINDSSEED